MVLASVPTPGDVYYYVFHFWAASLGNVFVLHK